MVMIATQTGAYQSPVKTGLILADLPEAEGGWKEYFMESDDGDLTIEDPYLRGSTALLLENTKQWMAKKCKKRDKYGNKVIDETTRSALLGGFSDYIFPIIRTGFPSNPISDIVSVQPTNNRVATVLYWNFVVGRGKGSYYPGMKLFDAIHGKQDAGFNFSNEVIDAENLPTQTAINTYDATLAFHDGGGVRPGSVRITTTIQIIVGPVDVPIEFWDNGNGGWNASVPAHLDATLSTIDYVTGAIHLDLVVTDQFKAATVPVATYRWDSEGSSMIPQIDAQVVSSTVETERRALMVNYSIEATQDVMSDFGLPLEANLVSGAAEHMNFEIARQIVHALWSVAPVVSVFPTTFPAAGYSQQEHFRDLVFHLNTANNAIWARTQKVYGNWIICDRLAATVIESLPSDMFVKAPRPANPQGLHFIGTLSGDFRVFKDVHLDKEPGASSNGNMLMGYKGTDFYDAGFVWAPYRLLYTTETLVMADFLAQKGMASRYATKMIQPDMYVRINLGP